MLSVAVTAAAAAADEEEGLPEPKLLPIVPPLLLLVPVVLMPPVPACGLDWFGGAVLGPCAAKGSVSHSMCPGCVLSFGGRRKQERRDFSGRFAVPIYTSSRAY